MDSQIQRLTERYPTHPIIRGLIQLIPWGIGSAVDVMVMEQLTRIREERAKIFFDELARGEQELTPELVESEVFLHHFFATADAVIKTRRHEKIQWFARLLLSSIDAAVPLVLDDEYEDYLKVLDELSYRELGILAILMRYEEKYPLAADENVAQRATRFKEDFFREIQTRLSIPEDEIESMLIRLNRTGTYETFYTYLGSVDGQGLGRVLPMFYRLAELIHIQDEEIAG